MDKNQHKKTKNLLTKPPKGFYVDIDNLETQSFSIEGLQPLQDFVEKYRDKANKKPPPKAS
jgi:hypothetical protein